MAARVGGVIAALTLGGLNAVVGWDWLILAVSGSLVGAIISYALFMFFSFPLAILGLVYVVLAVKRLGTSYKFNPFEVPQLPEAIDPKGLGMLAGGLALMGPLLSTGLNVLSAN
jgi:hypothetical protein